MAKLNGYEFGGWEGTLQAPTVKGPRMSQIRTWAIVADLLEAYVLAYTYSGLISAYGAYPAETPGGQEVFVRVAAINAVEMKKHKGGLRLVVDWSLVWG